MRGKDPFTDSGLVIEGRDILLRRVTLSDVGEAYCRWMNDEEVNRYMQTQYESQTHEDIRNYVTKVSDDRTNFFMAIIYKPELRHIGNIKLGPVNIRHRRGEVSLFIGEKELWGRSLAQQAIELIRDFGCNTLQLHKIKAACYSNHSRSARAFEKAGFVLEAVLRDEFLHRGEYVDQLCYAYINRAV
jgi:RimJ/RimL family protein N-acetyltransferase